jgi:hypothetical protein
LCKEFCGVIFFIVCSSGNCIVVLDEDSPTPNSWFLVTENWIFILFHQLLVSAGHQLSLFFEISTWPAIVAFFVLFILTSLSFLPYSYVILNSCYQLQSTYQFLSRSSCVILNQVDEASVIFCGKLLSSDSFSCFVGLDPNNQYHSLI